MDRAFDRRTDLAVLRTEARLKTIYKQASREITDKMQTWQKGHEKRDKMYRQMVKDGKMSKDDYDAWMRGQVFQGEQWAARKAQIDNVLYNAENAAAKIVNEGRIGVFTQNANRIGYELEHSGGVNIGFTLYDEATVSRLLKDNPRMLPPAKVQKPKAYSYYNRLVNNCVTQGIIQGESIDQIADRIVNKTGEASYSSAVRNARTSMTGAQNAGRIEGLHQAQELGVKVQKQWLATLDDHTRDAHRDLDGQIRDVDEPFEVNGLKIDYPGDPNADPSLSYNCRCTLVYIYPEYPDEATQRRDGETGELIEDMTYREWEAMKSEPVVRVDTAKQSGIINGVDITDTWERRSDQFDFEINDVINAQGFDGKPRVVDADDFDSAVQASGFIAQRSYSAPDQETLDAYRDQLYHGDWYVDCGTGGAQYGQGMYCAADYTGTLSEGIQNEMEHYRGLGESRYDGGGVSYTETLTLAPDAKIVTWREINDIRTGTLGIEYRNEVLEEELKRRGLSGDELTFARYNAGLGVSWNEVDAAARRLGAEKRNAVMEQLEDAGNTAQRRFNEEQERRRERARIYQEKYHDIGSLAAALGYDAINAENHGQSGSYTVILNRTKVIFRRP